MAAKKKGGGAAKGPAKTTGKKKKPSQKLHTLYDVSGDSFKRKKKTCAKCGSGVFLADHKDRLTCGKCGYMERK
ncbi:MAG: 30S ribosomal protein S27ae [Candidatus Woesearchaeota archaeon]|nr:MAG: 30S ribosomal protein S27ae [Candidatus Woesearchaeota archaeon]